MSWLISFALAYSSYDERDRELQNEEFLLTVEFEPETVRLRSDRANNYCAKKSYSIHKSKVDHIWPMLHLPIHVPHGRCSRSVCRVLHFVNTLQSANVYLGQKH